MWDHISIWHASTDKPSKGIRRDPVSSLAVLAITIYLGLSLLLTLLTLVD
jgi:hypothetical protein